MPADGTVNLRQRSLAMISVIIGALLPVVVTLALGMLAGWHRDQDVGAARSLNHVVLVYALPLALFTGTITVPRSELLRDWPLLIVLLAATALPFLLSLLVDLYFVHRTLRAAALQAMAFGFPAIAFTGIPILTPLIGDNAIVVVDFAGLTGNIIILPATLVLLSFAQVRGDGGGGNWRSTGEGIATALKGSLLQPVVLSPLLAIVLVLLNFHLPSAVSSSARLLGSTVGGISLFSSGIILQSQKPAFSLPAAVSSVARLLVIPGLTYSGLFWLGVSGDALRMPVLALGLAAAPMQVILSTRYNTDEQENASVLLYTNVLCIPTLAFFIWLTQ
jgi:malonate transporter and related proteins